MVTYTITYTDANNEDKTLTLSNKLFFEITYNTDTLIKKVIFSEYINDATEPTEIEQLLAIGSWSNISIILNNDNVHIPLFSKESVTLVRCDILSNRDRNGNDDVHDTDLIKTWEIE